MKWTEPSQKAKLAPPGWKLEGLSTHEMSYSVLEERDFPEGVDRVQGT